MRKNKKGTEKPIEIFLALFIILAVSMVMLRMFNEQISSKTKDLKKTETTEAVKAAIADARLECSNYCSRAQDEECSLRFAAAFCMKTVELDLNGDDKKSDFNAGEFSEGVCEDFMFCPVITGTCNCGTHLDISGCVDVLCRFWETEGYTDPQQKLEDLYLGNADKSVDHCNPGYPNMWARKIQNGEIGCE